jgi:hypothetical protein
MAGVPINLTYSAVPQRAASWVATPFCRGASIQFRWRPVVAPLGFGDKKNPTMDGR